MEKVELVEFATAAGLAAAAAGDWLLEVWAARDGNTPYCVALSGGRIARRFLSAAAVLAKQQGRGLPDSLHFFWSDERCVRPADPESNFGLARDCLLAPLAVADRQIHRLRGEVAANLAAAEGEAELRRFASRQRHGQPVLDLVLLGLGEDGHIASLFPGESEEVMTSPAVFRPVLAAPKPPPRRLTMGYPAIAAARQVWVLVSGEGKEKALRQSLTPAGLTPLARVLKSRDRTRIFVEKLSGST